MKRDAQISVVVLSYNRGAYLAEALQSLLSQSLAPSRITVLDNGSDPSVLEDAKPFLNKGLVHWRGSECNMGVHWNLQRAFEEGPAGNEFLFIMHDDDRLCPEFLSEQSSFLQSRNECIAVGCNAFEIDREGRRTGKMLHKPYRRNDVEVFDDIPAMVRLYMRTYLSFPSVLYRSSAVSGITVKPEFGQLVDVVLLTELSRAGKIAYINKALFEYRVHQFQDSHIFKENDWRQLEAYYRGVVQNYPELKLPLEAYLARRRLSRAWKQFKRRIAGIIK